MTFNDVMAEEEASRLFPGSKLRICTVEYEGHDARSFTKLALCPNAAEHSIGVEKR